MHHLQHKAGGRGGGRRRSLAGLISCWTNEAAEASGSWRLRKIWSDSDLAWVGMSRGLGREVGVCEAGGDDWGDLHGCQGLGS